MKIGQLIDSNDNNFVRKYFKQFGGQGLSPRPSLYYQATSITH